MNTEENMNKEEQQPDLGVLSSMRRKDVFKTPEGYFDELSSSIISNISTQSTQKEFSLFAYPRMIMAAAVIMAFVITGILYFTNNQESDANRVVLTYDDLIQAGMVSQFDNNMLMDYYLSLPQDSSIVDEQKSNKKMNDYLIENDIDISLIINEL